MSVPGSPAVLDHRIEPVWKHRPYRPFCSTCDRVVFWDRGRWAHVT